MYARAHPEADSRSPAQAEKNRGERTSWLNGSHSVAVEI